MNSPALFSATQNLYLEMLGKIQAGRWPVGSLIPSERALIDEFGVSRIAVREALSMLRGLGLVDVHHGRRTRIRRVDSEIFRHLLPVMLASGGQLTFDQIFEVRMLIETQTAGLAARCRSAEQLAELNACVAEFAARAEREDPRTVEADFQVHLQIARITGNPLYAILLEGLAGFVVLAQEASCRNDPVRRRQAVLSHQAIAEAIAAQDAARATDEMQKHLAFSASRRIDELIAPADVSRG